MIFRKTASHFTGSCCSGLGLWSERPLILLVAPIAFVQAPSYLLAHRGIAGYRDHGALLSDDLVASCLDREMFRSKRQASIGPVPTLPAPGHTFQKLNPIRPKHWFPPLVPLFTTLTFPPPPPSPVPTTP